MWSRKPCYFIVNTINPVKPNAENISMPLSWLFFCSLSRGCYSILCCFLLHNFSAEISVKFSVGEIWWIYSPATAERWKLKLYFLFSKQGMHDSKPTDNCCSVFAFSQPIPQRFSAPLGTVFALPAEDRLSRNYSLYHFLVCWPVLTVFHFQLIKFDVCKWQAHHFLSECVQHNWH